LNNRKTIFLDYQSTTPTAPEVLNAMLPYFNKEFGNPHSSDHAVGWRAAREVEVAAANVAKMIGADADEIVFTSGATESNNFALLGLARKNKSAKRKNIYVSATEHKCVLAASRAIKEESDYKVFIIPVNEEGRVDLEWLSKEVDERTLMVSIMAVNNEIGTIAPMEEISKICRSQGAIFHTDAAQAPYAVETRQLAEQTDLISLSGHKMYGPKGIGILFISRELQNQIEPIIYGGGQQNNLRSGTVPVPLAVGFGVAAKILVEGWGPTERLELSRLRDEFWNAIKKVFPKALLNGSPLAERHPGNLNVQFPGFDARDLLLRLQPNVAASTGSACTSGIEEPSHVLRAIGLSEDASNASIRFSLGRYTTNGEIGLAAKLLQERICN